MLVPVLEAQMLKPTKLGNCSETWISSWRQDIYALCYENQWVFRCVQSYPQRVGVAAVFYCKKSSAHPIVLSGGQLSYMNEILQSHQPFADKIGYVGKVLLSWDDLCSHELVYDLISIWIGLNF